MRIVVVNCQSIKSDGKPAQLRNLVSSIQADIVIGIESWLNPTIQDAEGLHQACPYILGETRFHMSRNKLQGCSILLPCCRLHMGILLTVILSCKVVLVKDEHSTLITYTTDEKGQTSSFSLLAQFVIAMKCTRSNADGLIDGTVKYAWRYVRKAALTAAPTDIF
jgi:hypothetical protein